MRQLPASAKVRGKGVGDDEADYALPIYAERLPVHTVLGVPEPCPRLMPGMERPSNLAGYKAGRSLGDALAESYRDASRQDGIEDPNQSRDRAAHPAVSAP